MPVRRGTAGQTDKIPADKPDRWSGEGAAIINLEFMVKYLRPRFWQGCPESSAHTTFHRYLGVHSLLIGLFPFYIPVYLWQQRAGLADISLFIAFSGAGFLIALWTWDRVRLMIGLNAVIACSLALEILLLYTVCFLELEPLVVYTAGIAYGIYNCFYWTTQRALFYDLIDTDTSGRKYGNLQILVGVLLQVGIVTGGFLLESGSFLYLMAASVLIALAGFAVIARTGPVYPSRLAERRSLPLRKVAGFRDADGSRLMFLADGFFLFAESYFWLITLFLLSHASFAMLGIVVLSLAVVFGLIFYLLKNTIDRIGRRRIYCLAVMLYAVSWTMRALIDMDMSLQSLYVWLVLITFCTSFFRLALNKRFYDLALLTLSHDYLVIKSYYTQAAIVLLFGLAAAGFFLSGPVGSVPAGVYWIAAGGSLVYLLYGARRSEWRGSGSGD